MPAGQSGLGSRDLLSLLLHAPAQLSERHSARKTGENQDGPNESRSEQAIIPNPEPLRQPVSTLGESSKGYGRRRTADNGLLCVEKRLSRDIRWNQNGLKQG